MATQLVDSLAGEWDPRQYHDTYTEELRQRIKDKQAGKELTVEAEPRRSDRPRCVDLMEALAASVESAKSRQRSTRAGRRSRTSDDERPRQDAPEGAAAPTAPAA